MDASPFTLSENLERIANQFPENTAIQLKTAEGYRRYSYKEFYQTSQSIAYGLINLGIKKEDKVAICLENHPQWGFSYFAILFSGAIAVPFDPQSSQEEIEYILGDSESKAVFIDDNLLPLFKQIISRIGCLKKVIVLDTSATLSINPERSRRIDHQGSAADIISFSELTSFASGAKIALVESSPEDIASILYTSGTTSRPKGVMLTHKNFYSNFQSISKLGLISKKDNILSMLPLHHSYPFMVTLIVPLFSQALVTYTLSLKKDELFDCLRESGVTILVGVPQIFYRFYRNISSEIKKIPFLIRTVFLGFIEALWLIRKGTGINLSRLILSRIHNKFGRSLRFFACGGAKLDKKAAGFLMKIGFTIIEGYGLSETSPVLTFNPLKKIKLGSVGRAIAGLELKVVDPDSQGIGEVAVRGPNLMKGYYKKDEETKAVIRNGWFYTADLGFLDKEGYLYLEGRKNELIVLSSGKNISPEELEVHYAQSPFIKELCVLTVEDKGEEKLKGVVVPDMDYYRKVGETNIQGAINWTLDTLSRQLPAYKRLMGFRVIKEDLPRTRLGKIKRYEVKDKYEGILKDELSKARPLKTSPGKINREMTTAQSSKKIIEILVREFSLEKDISSDDHLELDLGIDSLGRAELITALENSFQINIPDSLVKNIFTVGELIRAVEGLIGEKESFKLMPFVFRPQPVLWGDILKHNPPEDIRGKIDLSPSLASTAFALVSLNFLYGLFRVFFRLKIRGIENLPRKGSFILCPNHSSFLDGFLVAAAAPSWLKKNLYALGLRAYFDLPLIRRAIRLFKVIPIDPNARFIEAMQACAYVLGADKAVCLFPEGGRSVDGGVKEFKKGIGILAKELTASLIPVYIKGSYEAWPRTKPFPQPHPVKIIFGKPFSSQELKNKGQLLGAGDDYEAISAGLREEVLKLKKEVYL